MRSKSYFLFTAALLATVFFVLAGCSGSSSSQNGKGAITSKLVWSGAKTTAKSVASAPVGVATVRLSISGTGYSGIMQDFAAADGKGTLSGVLVGSGLTVTALGLDSSGAVIYQGSVSGVTVVDGQTTDVGTIVMQTPTFTTAMVSGKSFTFSTDAYGSTISGTATYNADGTMTTTTTTAGARSGTWVINSAGQLVLTYTDETDTMTLTNITGNVVTVNLAWTTASTSGSGVVTVTENSGGSYSNATLGGVWFTSQLGTNGSPLYLVSDGAGTFSDVSAFNLSTPPGTYSVNADGAYSMPFGFVTFTGSLTSSTTGTVTYSGLGSNGTLTKVADLSKCQGMYIGSISGGASTYATYTILFSVDSTGTISSFKTDIPGVTAITSSKFFSLADGTAIFMIRTNATGQEYKQIKGYGTLVNGQFNGTLELDSNAANGTVALTSSYWSGNTLYASPGNGSATVSGTDIKSVTFTSDAMYLYWTMELYGTPNTSLSADFDAGYSVTITKADGTEFDSRVRYSSGAWNNVLMVNKGNMSNYEITTAINGRIPLSLLGSGDITTFPRVGAYVYLGNNMGTMGIGN